MRKRIFSLGATIVVAFLAMTFDATAQNRGPQLEAEPLATEYANKLKTSLELTDAQKTKVYDIYLAIANENIPAIKERQSQGNGQNGQGGQNRQGGQSGQSTQGGQSNNQNRQGGQGGDQRSENRETPAFIFGMVFAQEGDANTKTEKAMKEVLSDGQYTKWVEIVEADRKAERPQRPQQREQR